MDEPKDLSFQDLLKTDYKFNLWDVYEKKKRVYRFSSIFKLILRSYLKRLVDSHQRGKCHSWPNLQQNIVFQRNLYNRIKFPIKPMRPGEGVDNYVRTDLAALATLITHCKESCGLREFPVEIRDFVRALSSGDAREALCHYALFKPQKLIRYIMAFYMEMLKNGPHFVNPDVVDALDSVQHMKNHVNGNFWDVFKCDTVLVECSEEMKKTGLVDRVTKVQDRFENNFRGLLSVIYKTLKHCTRDKKGNYYCQADLEWKFYCHFPFFVNYLWRLWKWTEKDDEVNFE